MMQNRSFEWKGSEILLADVSSVLEFESCPEIVDFARLCCLRPVTRATTVGTKAAWLKDARQSIENPLNDQII